MRILRIGSVFLAACVFASVAFPQGYDELWQQQDAQGLAQLHPEDADLFDLGGEVWRGRAEIEQGFARKFAKLKEDFSSDVLSNLRHRVFITSMQHLAEGVSVWDGVFTIEGLPEDDRRWAKAAKWTIVFQSRDDGSQRVCSWMMVPKMAGRQPPMKEPPTKGGISDPRAVELAEKLLPGYVEACNNHDLQALAAQFAPDAAFAPLGSLTWRVGSTVTKWHQDFPFTRWKDGRIVKLAVNSARFVTPEVLVVNGYEERTRVSETGEEEVVISMYFTIHVKTESGWKIKRMCTWAPFSPPEPESE